MISSCVLEQKLAYISRCEYKYFFSKSNVIGVGVGLKVKNGIYTSNKCITIFVTKKTPLNQLSQEDIIPSCYKGFLTDVIESEIPTICSLTKRIRPVMGGYSIGLDKLDPCSMGCLVADNHNYYMLSTNHGIAGNSDKSLKKVVVQPAPKYGGKAPKDVVGIVSKYQHVDVTSDTNDIDAALIETDRSMTSAEIAYIKSITGTSYSHIGESVKKVGSITELTNGFVKTKYTTIVVQFLGKMVTFKDQIATSKMSEKGDSGALLLNTKNQALGMLMADTSTSSIFNVILAIIDKLNVHIVRV